MKSLKKFWNKFWCVAESLGRARAASSMARQGNHKLAREIMMQQTDCR